MCLAGITPSPDSVGVTPVREFLSQPINLKVQVEVNLHLRTYTQPTGRKGMMNTG
jgi:hypothetical protein